MAEEHEKERAKEGASLDDLMAKVDPLSDSEKTKAEAAAGEVPGGEAKAAGAVEAEAAEAAEYEAASGAELESEGTDGATGEATAVAREQREADEPRELQAVPSGRAEDGKPVYPPNVQRLLDIQLPVTVSFGSTQKPLEEILKLTPGSLIELDTEPDDPVVLVINGKPFAWGRVVEVDGYYAVEITEIVERAERIQTLGG